MQHGMKSEKFKVIFNDVVLDEWNCPAALPELHENILKRLRREKKTIVCVFGSIAKSYAIDYLIEAVQKLNDDRLAIVIAGEGNQKEELIKKTEKMNKNFFLPQISKKSIPTLLKNVDCCYVGALRNSMFRFGICMNKLFDSMMSGKPILYAVEAPNNFVDEYSCGISVSAENADALADGIIEFMNLSEEEKRSMGSIWKKSSY